MQSWTYFSWFSMIFATFQLDCLFHYKRMIPDLIQRIHFFYISLVYWNCWPNKECYMDTSDTLKVTNLENMLHVKELSIPILTFATWEQSLSCSKITSWLSCLEKVFFFYSNSSLKQWFNFNFNKILHCIFSNSSVFKFWGFPAHSLQIISSICLLASTATLS